MAAESETKINLKCRRMAPVEKMSYDQTHWAEKYIILTLFTQVTQNPELLDLLDLFHGFHAFGDLKPVLDLVHARELGQEPL